MVRQCFSPSLSFAGTCSCCPQDVSPRQCMWQCRCLDVCHQRPPTVLKTTQGTSGEGERGEGERGKVGGGGGRRRRGRGRRRRCVGEEEGEGVDATRRGLFCDEFLESLGLLSLLLCSLSLPLSLLRFAHLRLRH